MSKKKNHNFNFQKRRRWSPVKAQQNLDLYFYTVSISGDDITVQQVSQPPEQSCSELDSMFTMTDEKQTWGLAIQITWLTGKPAPESKLRREGLLTILHDIHSQMTPEAQALMAKYEIGIAHAPPGSVVLAFNGEDNPNVH